MKFSTLIFSVIYFPHNRKHAVKAQLLGQLAPTDIFVQEGTTWKLGHIVKNVEMWIPGGASAMSFPYMYRHPKVNIILSLVYKELGFWMTWLKMQK